MEGLTRWWIDGWEGGREGLGDWTEPKPTGLPKINQSTCVRAHPRFVCFGLFISHPYLVCGRRGEVVAQPQQALAHGLREGVEPVGAVWVYKGWGFGFLRRGAREQALWFGPTASKTLTITSHKHKIYKNAHRSRVMTATPFSSSRNFTSCRFRGGPSISSCALGGCDETEWMAWVPAAVSAGGRGRWWRPKRLDGFGEEERRGRTRRRRRRPAVAAVVVVAMCCLWGGWVGWGGSVGVSDGGVSFVVACSLAIAIRLLAAPLHPIIGPAPVDRFDFYASHPIPTHTLHAHTALLCHMQAAA